MIGLQQNLGDLHRVFRSLLTIAFNRVGSDIMQKRRTMQASRAFPDQFRIIPKQTPEGDDIARHNGIDGGLEL